MTSWTVGKLWRRVEAETATDAIEAAKNGEHDEVNVAVARRADESQGMALLYLTADELWVAASAFGEAHDHAADNQALAESDELRRLLAHRRSVLNSLRTAAVEARWSLMTTEEIDAERQAEAAARAAGIIE